MKKLVSIALIAILSLGIVGCGQSDTTSAEPSATTESTAATTEAANPWEATVEGDGSWDRVVEAGKITAGLDDAFPPMGYHDPETDEIIGFDIAMAEAIGEKLGIEFEFIPADWNAIIPSIQTKKFDVIISGMNMWDTRIEQVNFVPYGVAEQYLLVKADTPDLDNINDVSYFEDKTIGTQLGSTSAKYLQALGFEDGKNLNLYKTFPEITVDLDNGRIDALAIDSFGAVELLETGNYVQVCMVPSDSADNEDGAVADYIGIAVRKEDGDLQRKLAQAVDELLVSGELKAISEEWIGGIDITESLVADAQARLDAAK